MKRHRLMTALVEESDALARIVAKNPSAPVSLRSEDEATRKNVILNPFTPYDVLSELENQFTELFVNNPALESYNSILISWNIPSVSFTSDFR